MDPLLTAGILGAKFVRPTPATHFKTHHNTSNNPLRDYALLKTPYTFWVPSFWLCWRRDCGRYHSGNLQ